VLQGFSRISKLFAAAPKEVKKAIHVGARDKAGRELMVISTADHSNVALQESIRLLERYQLEMVLDVDSSSYSPVSANSAS